MTSGLGGGSLVLAPAVALPRCGNLASPLPDVASASPADKFANLLPALNNPWIPEAWPEGAEPMSVLEMAPGNFGSGPPEVLPEGNS